MYTYADISREYVEYTEDKVKVGVKALEPFQ